MRWIDSLGWRPIPPTVNALVTAPENADFKEIVTAAYETCSTFAAAAIAAALWRPARYGAVLLAGAVVPMAAQAISAIVQVGTTPGPAQFGIPAATARQLGITISAGLTPAFWIYLGFLIALVVSCAWMLFTPQPAPVTPGDGYGWNGPRPDAAAGQKPGEAPAATPEAETPEASHTAASDHAAAGARDGDSPG